MLLTRNQLFAWALAVIIGAVCLVGTGKCIAEWFNSLTFDQALAGCMVIAFACVAASLIAVVYMQNQHNKSKK